MIMMSLHVFSNLEFFTHTDYQRFHFEKKANVSKITVDLDHQFAIVAQVLSSVFQEIAMRKLMKCSNLCTNWLRIKKVNIGSNYSQFTIG